MDYKARHPKIFFWPRSSYANSQNPAPFQFPGHGCIREVRGSDGTVFLSFVSRRPTEDEILTRYLIEAPRNCPMRLAFENGNLHFEDFCDQKGWLIRLNCPLLSESDYEARYIDPIEIDLETRRYFHGFNDLTPYQYLLNGLEFFLKIAVLDGEDVTKRKKVIEDFYKKYGDKIPA